MATGGTIESFSFAGRDWSCPADNEAQLGPGGFNAEVSMNGNLTARTILTAVPNKVDGLLVSIDHLNGDLLWWQNKSNSKIFEVLEVTLVDGSVYQCQAHVVGEVLGSTQSSTAAVSFNGPGAMTLQ